MKMFDYYFVACVFRLPLQRKIRFSEIAPFINLSEIVTKGLILIQCISCDRDMSWQPLIASKHSQVVQYSQPVTHIFLPVGQILSNPDFHDLLDSKFGL